MIDFSQFDSLIAMTMYFNNEDTCRQAIVEKRWGVGENQDIVCPYCGQHHCATRKDGKFRCNKCKRNFSCRVGTIFEDSNLSLVKWFIAMYLISSHKKGVSSCQLSRDIKVCQATAWYMLQKIRKLYKALWSVTRCTLVERKSGSISPCALPIRKVVPPRPRHLFSV